VRSSALWGKRSGARSSALWGKGGRGRKRALIAVLCAALVAPAAAHADAYVPADLFAAAQANPNGTFPVVVQGRGAQTSAGIATAVGKVAASRPSPGAGVVHHRFAAVSGVSARISGAQLVALARNGAVGAITRDARVRAGRTAVRPRQPRPARAAPGRSVFLGHREHCLLGRERLGLDRPPDHGTEIDDRDLQDDHEEDQLPHGRGV
jgi:hypothetical protein